MDGYMDDHAGVAMGLSRIAAAMVDYQMVHFSGNIMPHIKLVKHVLAGRTCNLYGYIYIHTYMQYRHTYIYIYIYVCVYTCRHVCKEFLQGTRAWSRFL